MPEDYMEYVVDEVTGRSSSPGNPDRIANMILDRWGFVPKGENPADHLFLGAVPPSKFACCYRLKVLDQGTLLQAWLHRYGEGEDQGKLDFGPVRQNEDQPTNGHKTFVMEGNYLSKIVVVCRPLIKEDVQVDIQPIKPESVGEVPTPATTINDQILTQAAEVSLSAELMQIQVSRIRRNSEQPRKKFNASDLLVLGLSMKDSGQTDRIEVIRVTGDPDADFELVKGERRWRAASLVGITVLNAIVLSKAQIPDKNVQHSVCLISDLHHSKYSDVEIAFALARERANGNKTLQQLATMCKKKSTTWVAQHLAITNLHPDLLKLLNPDLPRKEQMSFSIAWRLARLIPVEQIKVYEQVSKIKGAALQVIETDKLVAKLRPGEGRKKDPADLYRNLGSIVPRILADTSTAEGYPGEVFLSLVQHRPAEEIQLMVDRLEQAKQYIDGLKAKILSARSKWGECQKI